MQGESCGSDARARLRRWLERVQLGCCAYCGRARRIQVEHIVPRALGGRDVFENLAGACWSCNRRKADKPLDEWFQEVGPPADERVRSLVLGALLEAP